MLILSLLSISCLAVLHHLYHKTLHFFLPVELDIFYIFLKDLETFTGSLDFKASSNFYTAGIFAMDNLWTKILLYYSERFQHFQNATSSSISLSVSWNSVSVDRLGDAWKLSCWVFIQKANINHIGEGRRRRRREWWKLYHFYCFGWIILPLILSTCSNYFVFDQNTFRVLSLM